MKNRKYLISGIGLGIFTLIVYLISYTGEVKHLDYFVPLADAFLHGRIYLFNNPSWLNELISIGGKYYVVYPPMPALLLVPFVALFGPGFEQPFFSILVGAINVSLCFFALQKLFKNYVLAIAGALLFGMGSMQWFHAVGGSAWYIAHIIAIFFLWLMVIETVTKKRLFVIGLLIGAAYWSRLPTILAVFFPLTFLAQEFIRIKPKVRINFRNLFSLSFGIFFFIILNSLYNYLRFGVFYDVSYQLLPVFDEPWYQNGLFSIFNIPIHLYEFFFSMPRISHEFPYIVPSLLVLAIWVVTPAFLLLPFSSLKRKLNISLIITILIMSLPGFAHGSNGFTQFGYRFSLDYHPFLVLLLVSVMTQDKKLKYIGFILIILSILMNIWGIVMINFLHKWTM